MGCGGSTVEGRRQSDVRRQSIFTKIRRGSIKIGNDVTILDSFPRLIFVFGGPGTKKGRVLNDLMSIFGLRLINVENIIIQALYAKLDPEEPKTTASIQKLVKKHPELLRLDWTMKQITSTIESCEKDHTYLVDFMPNLKFLLNSNTFIKECDHEFRHFEGTYPISCAIYLSIPVDKIMKKKQAECTTFNKESDKPEKQQENQAQRPAQSDEASTHRTRTRATIFETAVQYFITYFEMKGKLVKMDVSTCGYEATIEHMCEFFIDKDFNTRRNINSVVLFAFSDADMSLFDGAKMEIVKIALQNMQSSADNTPEQLIQLVSKRIDSSLPTESAFVVNTTGTSLTKDYINQSHLKHVLFQDSEDCGYTKFVPMKLPSKIVNNSLQAVSTNHQVCLFSKDVPMELCQYIALLMTADRHNM